MFVVIPAIDLLENNAVRLVQGDYTHSTTYSNNAIELSKKFETSGTKRLHIVDLGGAKSGRPEHFELIKQIRQNTTMQIEVGGGIRDIETVEKYFKAGINYLILGSMLLKNKPLALDLLKKYGEKIIIGIDGKDGFVKTEGWLQSSNTPIVDLLLEMQKAGAKQAIVTDINRDGMLTGPNFELYKTLGQKTKLQIIASGGVSSLEDLKKLKQIPGVLGAITGKALYENKFSLEEALKV
jgi:phosphoribosylformimino-5-aminoimidazole carboxamide ribotide isomerase